MRAVIATGGGWGVSGVGWVLVDIVGTTTQGPLSVLLWVPAWLPWFRFPISFECLWYHWWPTTLPDPSRPYDEEKSEALSHQDICRKPHSKRTLRWNTRRRLQENFPGCLARDQRLLFSNFWLTKLNYRIPIKVKILISETFFDTQNFNERWQTILVFRDVLFDVHCHHEIEK